jgi:hypothetical protein
MTGIEMALKAMGLDPEKIKTEITQLLSSTVIGVMKEVNEIKSTEKRIECKLDLLLEDRGLRGLEQLNSEEVENGYGGKLDTGVSGS